ncbi:hypothetical protein DFJ58DRAFT_746727 [Suillus subalutaceus]|uniref:uncharacterized protein n=1 Tax=Suillus subalutaceus TaxID=48586 RepID=UPI001B860E2A|nr:uncharacterized protein DFJ58DRAFT_746727 [Suillus subalutaceus]KAG1848937.1 hypothetical protein DFJ58DRAFT_746727 [Suillus subalutaceus]
MAVDLVLKLYVLLDSLNTFTTFPGTAHCICIAFRLTAVKRCRTQAQEVKADGLHDLLITTEVKLIQVSSPRPTMDTFLFVRPWNRYVLELPDVAANDTQSEEDY